jgi:hypothetical protein
MKRVAPAIYAANGPPTQLHGLYPRKSTAQLDVMVGITRIFQNTWDFGDVLQPFTGK